MLKNNKEHHESVAQHMIIDPETGLEACGFCNKVYKGSQASVRKQNLTDHIYSIHLKLKRYECQFCDKKLTSKSGLFNHMKLKHPEEYEKKQPQVKKEKGFFDESDEEMAESKVHDMKNGDGRVDDEAIDEGDEFKVLWVVEKSSDGCKTKSFFSQYVPEWSAENV